MLKEYVAGWKKKKADRKKRIREKLRTSRKLARRCARLLHRDFEVDRVYLVGSTVQPERFHDRSDLDLVVEGLAPEDYFVALKQVVSLLPEDLELDLIPMEDLSPERSARVVEEGELLL